MSTFKPNRYTPEGKAHHEAGSSVAWAGFGFGLIADSLSNLFRPKGDDESWGDFVTEKIGLLTILGLALGVVLFAAVLFYMKYLA